MNMPCPAVERHQNLCTDQLCMFQQHADNTDVCSRCMSLSGKENTCYCPVSKMHVTVKSVRCESAGRHNQTRTLAKLWGSSSANHSQSGSLWLLCVAICKNTSRRLPVKQHLAALCEEERFPCAFPRQSHIEFCVRLSFDIQMLG